MKRWLLCVLEFNGRHRAVMAPDRYTELFFLDEATATRGRPPAVLRMPPPQVPGFRDAWAKATGDGTPVRPIKADEIDERLHAERDRSRSREAHFHGEH